MSLQCEEVSSSLPNFTLSSQASAGAGGSEGVLGKARPRDKGKSWQCPCFALAKEQQQLWTEIGSSPPAQSGLNAFRPISQGSEAETATQQAASNHAAHINLRAGGGGPWMWLRLSKGGPGSGPLSCCHLLIGAQPSAYSRGGPQGWGRVEHTHLFLTKSKSSLVEEVMHPNPAFPRAQESTSYAKHPRIRLPNTVLLPFLKEDNLKKGKLTDRAISQISVVSPAHLQG